MTQYIILEQDLALFKSRILFFISEDMNRKELKERKGSMILSYPLRSLRLCAFAPLRLTVLALHILLATMWTHKEGVCYHIANL